METTLHQASHEWATRGPDERFTSLEALATYCAYQRNHSKAVVIDNRRISARPVGTDHKGIEIVGTAGVGYTPTHWAFGQLAGLAKAPAGYLRTLPSEMVADCLNYGLHVNREVTETGLLLRSNGARQLAAATGPNYGRIWNSEIADMFVRKFADSPWTIPGEFGRAVEPTKENTTLFASDRDMFLFLADETRRIEVPNRRNGSPGSLARGFFAWNSEVGSSTIGAAFFLFDYACCNRIVWGAQSVNEIRIRHTSGAPSRWLEEIVPVLDEFAHSSPKPIEEALAAAREASVGKRLDDFLANRFGTGLVNPIKAAFELDEARPIENVWDVVTAATAYARAIPHQDERVALERKAGELLMPAIAQRELVRVRA